MPNAHNRPLRFTRKDTAGELSPSTPSPLRGESWGEAAALWILLANSLRLLPLHAVERAGVRPPPFGFANSIRKDGDPKEPGSSTPPSSTEPSFGRAAAY